MALSNQLAKAGHEPKSVRTTAQVHLVKGADGFSITKIELSCRAHVPGIDEATFIALAASPFFYGVEHTIVDELGWAEAAADPA